MELPKERDFADHLALRIQQKLTVSGKGKPTTSYLEKKNTKTVKQRNNYALKNVTNSPLLEILINLITFIKVT